MPREPQVETVCRIAAAMVHIAAMVFCSLLTVSSAMMEIILRVMVVLRLVRSNRQLPCRAPGRRRRPVEDLIPGGTFSQPNPTQVIVKGEAYPGSSVNILKDGAAIGIVQADTSGNFYFSTTNLSPGVATFGFWAQDANGLKSVALTTTVTITANAATTISGELLPPTITIDKRQLSKGDTLTISGQSAPSVTVETHIHSAGDIVITTSTDGSGNWKMFFNTKPLDNNELHTVDADFVTTSNGANSRSELSQSISFFLGSGSSGKSYLADLNGDSKVNLADFSILLYYWGTSTPLADLNGDGKVDLQDLSILLYYWTG